jgi:hypothetical protein
MSMYDHIKKDLEDFAVCKKYGLPPADFAGKYGSPLFPHWAVARVLRKLEKEKENLERKMIRSYRLMGVATFGIICCIFLLFYTSI